MQELTLGSGLTVDGAGVITVAGGGGGVGDVSSSVGLSVDSELALFDGTSGKLLKRGTGTGLALLTSGVLSITAAPTGAVVGTTDTQTLTGKTISGANNTLTVRDLDLVFTDVTTANVSTTAHGLTPKAPGGTTQFLRGDATWAVPPGGGGAPTDAEYITSTVHASLSAARVLTDTATITWDRATAGQIKANAIGGGYTDEQAQDAVGAMLLATATIVLTYTDATPSLSASVIDASITEAKLGFSDVTTKDASTTAHGLLRKLSGTATEYLNGTGAWTTPPGGGTNYWTRTAPAAPSYLTGMLAWWRMEEASGNRVSSVGTGLDLVPTGTPAQITQVSGITGSAVGFVATANTYLSLADNATMSAGVAQSFTIACWVYLTAATGQPGVVSKGNATVDNKNIEYQIYISGGQWVFNVGNGSFAHVTFYTGSIGTGAWHFVVGWWDSTTNTQYLQVDNGTIQTTANTHGSYESTSPFDVGRQGAMTTATYYLNGRVDNVMFAKRVWTMQERTDLWNSGIGVDYGVTSPYLSPATATDRLALTATPLTQERLEVDGALKLGTTTGTTDGTLRWTGTDFEGRKAGAWVSMTAGAGGQPLDATLTALAGLATGADQLPYATGTDTFAQTPLTAFARTLRAGTTQAAMRTTLGLTPGTDVQAQDAELTAIAGLTSAADRVPYFTGLGTAALATFTAAGRALAGAADAAAQRATLGLGTMAQQDASAVAITGGNINGVTNLTADPPTFVVDGTTHRVGIGNGAPANGLDVNVPAFFRHVVGLGGNAAGNIMLSIEWARASTYGMLMHATDLDAGGIGVSILFTNVAGTGVGSINASATATAYNTSSDVRLKHSIAPLAGALDVVRRLRPITHLWNADDSRGYGFLAHELQREIPDAVSGEPGAVNEEGSIRPQQVDHSRLVVWCVAALQEAVAQVAALQARVASLEEQLGV